MFCSTFLKVDMSDSNTKPIAAGSVAVANKAWDEEVSAATELEDDDDVPCRPSPLTRQVAFGTTCETIPITQYMQPIKDDRGPATSLPATSLPATSLPATSLPATSLPATSLPATSMWGAHNPGEWKCDVCLTRNPPTALIECLSCEAEKKSV